MRWRSNSPSVTQIHSRPHSHRNGRWSDGSARTAARIESFERCDRDVVREVRRSVLSPDLTVSARGVDAMPNQSQVRALPTTEKGRRVWRWLLLNLPRERANRAERLALVDPASAWRALRTSAQAGAALLRCPGDPLRGGSRRVTVAAKELASCAAVGGGRGTRPVRADSGGPVRSQPLEPAGHDGAQVGHASDPGPRCTRLLRLS